LRHNLRTITVRIRHDYAHLFTTIPRHGVVTRVGYNYQHNPIIGLVRELIQSGKLSEIIRFRCEAKHPGGALADLGCHLLGMARYLYGDVGMHRFTDRAPPAPGHR
jgi:predicted dehydrogenase